MGASRCFSPVRGNAMRVTKLDGCGRPVYGDDSVGVSDGFVSVAFTANTDEGEEINIQNAAGKTCVRDTPCPTLLGYTVEIEFCNVDPALFAILTGQEPITDYTGAASGFRINSDVSGCDSGFGLELWTGVPGVACSDASDPTAQPSGYLLLPYLQGGILGDFTIENGGISFTVTGAATKTGSGWGVGPYNVLRTTGGGVGPLADPIVKGDHMHVEFTDVAHPNTFCGTQPLLDPDGAAMTGLTATATALQAVFTPVPAGTSPFWVDFGDGTWDYSPNGSALTHNYAAAGTWQFVGYRGSSKISGQVVSTTPVPTITTLAPATGPVAGGTAVVLTGTNLLGSTAVQFGGTAGTAFSVTDATHIAVTTPAHAAGAVVVTVSNPGGTASKTAGFTYS